MRVLIVEDDVVLADGLERYLRQAGYSTDLVADGAHADAVLTKSQYDLVILDIGLPRLDGFAVLRRLRGRGSRTHVLVLTARDAVEDRVHGLNLGADDYLVKPFSLVELEARLRAIARRHAQKPDTELVYGQLTLNVEGRRASIAGSPLRLTARELQLLEFLVLRAGKIVGKDQIVHALSTKDEEMSHSAVEVHISHIRQKLGPAGVRIRAIRGLGYYLEK